MYKDVLRAIEGVDIFPVISLILFFSFFVGLVYYVMQTDKEIWDKAAQLPLEAENEVKEGQLSSPHSDSLTDPISQTSPGHLTDPVSETDSEALSKKITK